MISPSFFIKRADLLPIISTTITDAAGTPIDLTGASVQFVMRGPWDAAPIIAAAATIVSPATSGVVTYAWTGTQTGAAGSFRGEFVVTFPSAKVQSFPTTGYIDIEIGNDLATGAAATPLYCSPNDMLLGDLQVPPTIDINVYINRASRDVDIAMGAQYTVPMSTLTGRGQLVIRNVTADLASAYLLMAQAQGGEDNTVNAYGMQLYNRAWSTLLPFRQGEPLDGAVLANPPDYASGGSSSAISIRQQDKTSILAGYEKLVHTVPTYGTPNYDDPYSINYGFYGEDGAR